LFFILGGLRHLERTKFVVDGALLNYYKELLDEIYRIQGIISEGKGGIEPRYDLLELFEKHTTHYYAFERGLYRDMTIERRYDFAVSLIKDLEVAV
jgi:uncharacterized tellurite resistance protein B-like protein